MLEGKPGCVQRLPLELPQDLYQFFGCPFRQRKSATVGRVADQRVTTVREVDPDLVRPARLEAYIDTGERGEPFFDRVMRNGRFAILAHTHPLTIDAMPADRLTDRTAAGQHAVTNREVMSRNFAIRQQAHEGCMRCQGLGDQQQATRVLVEAVNDAGTRNFIQGRYVVQQSVQQRPRRIPRAGVHDQAGGLVDDQKIVVLVHDIEFDQLRFCTNIDLRHGLKNHGLAPGNRVARPGRPTLHHDGAAQQPLFQSTPRIFRKHSGQRLVQSQARQFGGNRGYLFFGVHDWTLVYGILASLESPGGLWRYLNKDNSMQFKSLLNPAFPRGARLVFVASLCASLMACAGKDEIQTEVQNITEAYELAQESIDRKNYRKGIQIFEAIQARYPFSDLSRQIQLELMHAYYKSGEFEQSIEAADTFIRENPIHARVDYALYIKGLSYYEPSAGYLERWFKRDITKRPPKDVDLAYSTLRRLVERYPTSEYAADAEQRILAIKERMSAYENHVADYYLRRGAYVAAANRAKNALEEYNGATGNPESLRILIEAYEKLGMDDLAADARRVLEINFPDES